MKILVADDSIVYRKSLVKILTRWDYEVEQVSNGDEALARLLGTDPPRLAVLDWMMPGINGTDICRAIRRASDDTFRYLILLTARDTKDDIVSGLDAGADDYIIKPFDEQELRQRIKAGERIVTLEQIKQKQIAELRAALEDNKQLRGILPICAWCSRIRDDHDYWSRVEDYFGRYSKTEFTHSICPDCRSEQLIETDQPDTVHK